MRPREPFTRASVLRHAAAELGDPVRLRARQSAVTVRLSPAHEGEEHLIDDGGDGVLVPAPEQELVAE